MIFLPFAFQVADWNQQSFQHFLAGPEVDDPHLETTSRTNLPALNCSIYKYKLGLLLDE